MLKKIFLLLSLLCCTACTQKTPPAPKPTVLVSIAPYAYFVHRIAGPDIDVRILIPENANPHIYEPKPQEIKILADAQLWIRLGDPADQKAYLVFKDKMHIVDVTQGISLLSECTKKHSHHCAHDDGDLHIWLSPRLAKIQATSIAAGLIATFPDQKEIYQQRLSTFLKELDTLDLEISTLLKPKAGDAILVSHPAFAYFCRDYHLTQLSIEMEGKDPLPQHITTLLNEAQSRHVTAVLLQPQYSNKGALLIAEKLGIPAVTVNPYAEDYIDNLRHIAQIIAHTGS